MKFLSYSYEDSSCSYPELSLKKVNLFVGATGSGKTRLFHTIFNLGACIVNGITPAPGEWKVRFESEGNIYEHLFILEQTENELINVKLERLTLIKNPACSEVIFEKEDGITKFKGAVLPRMRANASSLLILDEDIIKPVIRGYSSIIRRNFFADELVKASIPAALNKDHISKIENKNKPDVAGLINLPLSITLTLIQNISPEKFHHIQKEFKLIFPFVTHLEVKGITEFPAFSKIFDPNAVTVAIKEFGVKEWTPISQIASGMLKVLLILTDLAIMEKGFVYMIDEYENSLGVNAIDFLPNVFLDYDEIQFLIISHHPYLINKIPMKNWFVLGRKGKNIKVKFGDDLLNQYGISKQQAFLKLINDPFFKGEFL